MASRRRAAPVEQSTNSFPPPLGNFILRSWQGLYHIFGARISSFDFTPEGFTAVNLTMDEKWDVNSILDVLVKNDKARLSLFPLYNWIMGVAPEPFSSAAELTVWQTQNIAAGEKNRRPKFVKDAIQDYKTTAGIAVPRGRPRKHFQIAELGELNTEVLEGTDMQELTRLRETIDKIVAPAEAVKA